MATKKTAIVEVNFNVTVRVPVSADELPVNARPGDEISYDVTDDVWNQIVSTACEVMEEPFAGDVDSITVVEVENDGEEEEEMLTADYDNCPEYVHDAAVDWIQQNIDAYPNSLESAKEACLADLAAEGYNIEDLECRWAVDDAFEEFEENLR